MPLLLIAEPDGDAALVYDRRVQGREQFDMTEDGLRDTETGSRWTYWGKCTEWPLMGEQLTQVQSYQQFLRAWISFMKVRRSITFEGSVMGRVDSTIGGKHGGL